jgi:hypothetical protein
VDADDASGRDHLGQCLSRYAQDANSIEWVN